ncbi:MAG: cation:proton antiporter [Candidatus Diapherotrites archaeon]
MEILMFFFFIAVVMIIGFFGNLIFNKTKISDITILLLLGLLVGPILQIVDPATVAVLKGISPLFASLALIVLLFEGGLHLNFYRVITQLSKATGFTVLVFTLSMGFTALVMSMLGWPILYGLLLGAITGGISSAIVIPIINKTNASPETKTLITLESALTDAIVVIVALAILEIIISNYLDIGLVAQNIFAAFSIAAVVGVLAGIIWLKLLRDFNSIKEYEYILTVATLFLIYVLVEFVGGNGAISALVFGLILGNSAEIMTIARMEPLKLDRTISSFNKEISFFVKTFFFVYLGLIFEISAFNLTMFGIAILIMAVAILARGSIAMIFAKINPHVKKDRVLITALMARGLAAAVLATYPAVLGLEQNDFFIQITQITFLVILISNIATTIGVYAAEKNLINIDGGGTPEIKTIIVKKKLNAQKQSDNDLMA